MHMKYISGILGTMAILAGMATADLELNPTQFGASVDFGQTVKNSKKSNISDMHPITRTGVYLTASGTYNNKFIVTLTTGGLFWYALPDRNPSDTRIMFGPGVGQARGLYKFGNPERPYATLQFGLFGHKYNSDSKNLGEYLYRCGTYPGYIWTGGWSYVNSAAYLAQGLRFTLLTFKGKITHDFTLYMERDYAPAHDLSPGYNLNVKPASFLEFGAGIVWASGLSFKPDSILSPTDRRNAYDKNGIPLHTSDIPRPGYAYYGPGNPKNNPLVVEDSVLAGGVMVVNPLLGARDANEKFYVSAGPAGNDPAAFGMDISNGTPVNELNYYTFQGFKGMLHASFDIGTLMGLKENAFKLYGETALLGFKDYPFYYAKKSERMPIMFGLNIPTFGILDMLAFEMEYLKSPFQNNFNNAYDQRLPVPEGGDPRTGTWKSDSLDVYVEQCGNDAGCTSGRNGFETAYNTHSLELQKEAKKNDWKWSVYASRKIMEGISLTAQIASDHLRHLDIVYAKPSGEPATTKPSEWYYVLRLEFGI